MNFIMNSVQFFSLVALQGLEYFRQHEFDEWSGVGCLGTCCYYAWTSHSHRIHSTGSYWRWGLRAEGKDIWWKCGVGILGEIEGGKARFEGFGGELGRVERR